MLNLNVRIVQKLHYIQERFLTALAPCHVMNERKKSFKYTLKIAVKFIQLTLMRITFAQSIGIIQSVILLSFRVCMINPSAS